MCDKTVVNYYNALEFAPDCYIIHKMHNNAVDTYPSAT